MSSHENSFELFVPKTKAWVKKQAASDGAKFRMNLNPFVSGTESHDIYNFFNQYPKAETRGAARKPDDKKAQAATD